MCGAGRNVGAMKHVLAFVIALLVSPVAAEPVVIFAAASLKEPVDQIAALHGDAVVSYGGSGALARQVMQGAPADVVILAHPVWMDELVAAGAVKAATDQTIASNALVMIGPSGAAPLALTDSAIAERLINGRLAIGFTNAVPAGQYGKAALQSLGLWKAATPHLAQVDNVRAALALVARGEVPLGIVYATDAAASEAVSVVARFPADTHPPITYQAAPVRESTAGAAFMALIQSAEGRAAFDAAGFGP